MYIYIYIYIYIQCLVSATVAALLLRLVATDTLKGALCA